MYLRSHDKKGSNQPGRMEEIASLIKYLQQRDELRAQEAEQCRLKDERRRAQKAETRRQEFAAFMAALTTRPLSPPLLPGTQQPPQPPTQNNKPVIKPPSPLQADASFQQFRDWRRRWQDYSVVTDLSTIPLAKQHIQLRTCLGPEILHILQYRLQLPQDDSTPIPDVLSMLDKYYKAQTNEALRRRGLFSCRQEAGETFNDFYLRVKNLTEAVTKTVRRCR